MQLFKTFFLGGFECSTHRRGDGLRLDLIAATQHDVFARRDYQALQRLGISTVRDGIRWHLIEQVAGYYDFKSVVPMIRAAQVAGTQVIWDVCHYGWPDDLDVFSPAFVRRLASFTRAFTKILREETGAGLFISPLNEPSFLSWAGAEVGYINPRVSGRGFELKQQLTRAIVESVEAVWDVAPDARIVHCEPAIHIAAGDSQPHDRDIAEEFRLFQFQSLDMIAGRVCPELGGKIDYLDLVGLNYYWNNQWLHNGRTLVRNDSQYKPLRELLREFQDRYGRPVFVSETGIEGDARPGWLAYVASEVLAARESGVAVEGICLYPILDHPGWDNDRHCPCGLLGYADETGRRESFRPLETELKYWQRRLEPAREFEFASLGGANE